MGKLKVFGTIGAIIFGNLGTLKKAENLAAQGDLDARDRVISKFADEVCDRIFRAAETQMQIEGEENIPAGTCVFVANHQSIFDALVMLAVAKNNRPCGFIMKKEHEKIPLARRWCTQLGCVFVDRENPRAGVRALKEAEANLARGVSMVVFPEGTRTKNYPHLGPFKNGAFKIAQSGKYPIVPVILYDAGERFEAADKMTGGTIHMKVLPPVTLTGTDRKEYKLCAAQLEEKFRAEIEEYFKF